MLSGGKTLQDQVVEIRQLISDASETLRQANWALGTLETRLGDTSEQPAPEAGSGEAPGGSSVAEPGSPDSGTNVPEPTSAGAEERRRHRRWIRGVQGPPDDPADT
jgi:hypothetical protein